MALTPQDISRIAHLARLELSAAEQARMLTQLNGFFGIVEQMGAVDTTGVEPLYTRCRPCRTCSCACATTWSPSPTAARQPAQRAGGRGRPVPGAEGDRMSAALHDLTVAELASACAGWQQVGSVEAGAAPAGAHRPPTRAGRLPAPRCG
jgi:hypothetical protein